MDGKGPAIQDSISVTAYQNDEILPLYNWEPNRAVWSGCSWINALYNTTSIENSKPVKIKVKLNVDTPVIPEISFPGCLITDFKLFSIFSP